MMGDVAGLLSCFFFVVVETEVLLAALAADVAADVMTMMDVVLLFSLFSSSAAAEEIASAKSSPQFKQKGWYRQSCLPVSASFVTSKRKFNLPSYYMHTPLRWSQPYLFPLIAVFLFLSVRQGI